MHGLKYTPVASIIGWQLREPDWTSVVTFDGAHNFDVANSLDGVYLGPFTIGSLVLHTDLVSTAER